MQLQMVVFLPTCSACSPVEETTGVSTFEREAAVHLRFRHRAFLFSQGPDNYSKYCQVNNWHFSVALQEEYSTLSNQLT